MDVSTSITLFFVCVIIGVLMIPVSNRLEKKWPMYITLLCVGVGAVFLVYALIRFISNGGF